MRERKTANRPEFARMLQYLRENRLEYVIVHKVDRLAQLQQNA